MIAKNNRQNSNFQILHFLVGSCHTPDAAYSLLSDLLEDREFALAGAEAAGLRHEVKVARAQQALNSEDELARKEAQADLLELEAGAVLTAKNILAAQDEVAFIKDCMTKLEPHRKYAQMSLPEANQAMQRDEWRLELQHRAENYLLTQGVIPADQFATMRMHPDFKAQILPHIEQTKQALLSNQAIELLPPVPIALLEEL